MTESNDWLLRHRMYIEENKLGFGDRAFHYMWYLLLQYLFQVKTRPQFLEIGVYKGQVISLWSLIAKELKSECDITCITPLSGNIAPKGKILFYLNFLLRKKFRSDTEAGNFYDNENYAVVIKSLFEHFGLSFEKINLHKGLSTDAGILEKFKDVGFDLIYIDGDHAREAVEMDIKNYSSRINAGGFLVMDDASSNLPGAENKEYWKGHKSVSDACEIIPALGFKNVLNVGHNRIYQKIV
jgi:hypothetical protein